MHCILGSATTPPSRLIWVGVTGRLIWGNREMLPQLELIKMCLCKQFGCFTVIMMSPAKYLQLNIIIVCFEYHYCTIAFGKCCMARPIAPLFGIRGSGCMCARVCPIPLVHGGWLMCTRPNSLQATDCGLYFSFPLSLINGCIDKQTSWAKGSSSERGGGVMESETEGGGGSVCLSSCWRCPAFLAGVTLL